LLLIDFNSFAQTDCFSKSQKIKAEKWADSVLFLLSTEEKIGQLLMIASYSGKSQNQKNIEWAIKKYKVGGLIFFKGEPTHQVKLTNQYQSMSTIPLLISMDAEWGVGMRLDSVISFPKQMSFGFTNDTSLVYEMGSEVARQCKRLGIHINFAPVIDINDNPENPVIHLRSFGENKEMVTRMGLQYMKSLQENGILAVGKHFPGHGNTSLDSHKDLPVLSHDAGRIYNIELYPFKKLTNAGLEGMMIAHLNVPAFDTTAGLPASLSGNIINSLLKEQLGFKGLVFTDALNMKGVTKNYESGNIELKALLAGNDILLYPQNVAKAVHTIERAYKEEVISDSFLNAKVKKVLIYKYLLTNGKADYISPVNVTSDLNNKNAVLLKRKIIEKSICLLKNDNELIPIKGSSVSSYLIVYIGSFSAPHFQTVLNLYGNFKYTCIHSKLDSIELDSIKKIISGYKNLIIVLSGTSSYNVTTFGLSNNLISLTNELLNKHSCILVNFGSPYLLKFLTKSNSILQCTESDTEFQDIAAQMMMGAIPVIGKLPVSINTDYKYGSGIIHEKTVRLKYTIPEELGIDNKKLNRIDSIIYNAIRKKAFPGCQVLIAKNGKVFYHKSFGYHTYDKTIKVNNSDIYDVASITKVAATLLPVMRYYELGLLKPETKIRKFVDVPIMSGFGGVTIKELLTHESGFAPWIPFYKKLLNSDNLPDSVFFSDTFSLKYSVPVSDNLFAISNIEDYLWKQIFDTEVNKSGKYVYSDLNFIFLRKIIDLISQENFDEYLDKNFYSNLGMNNTMFNPSGKVFPDRIPPTEIDNYFRQAIVQAYVHDPSAALFGGIAGHAGLFSNANDLAKLMFMWLNKGTYANERYFKSSTIDTFTMKQSEASRRGLGFDKPETVKGEYSPTSYNTPLSTYGHTGFTGCCVWADPDNQIIYVFLSNRTFPDQNNKTMNDLKVRQEIQKVIYEIVK